MKNDRDTRRPSVRPPSPPPPPPLPSSPLSTPLVGWFADAVFILVRHEQGGAIRAKISRQRGFLLTSPIHGDAVRRVKNLEKVERKLRHGGKLTPSSSDDAARRVKDFH